MNALTDILGYPIPLWLLLIYMAASSAIGALPKPTEQSSTFYVWLFQFLNLFASNISRALAAKRSNNLTNGGKNESPIAS